LEVVSTAFCFSLASRKEVVQDLASEMVDSQDPFGLNNLVRANLLSTEDRMVRLGKEADIYEKLTASLAPSIWNMDDVKKGILCQLFGATVKVCCSNVLQLCATSLRVHCPRVKSPGKMIAAKQPSASMHVCMLRLFTSCAGACRKA
jgi:hypothetical protein